ncbi:MAG: hypothetical protein RJA52_1046, partial [Bacteroidota bacterium]
MVRVIFVFLCFPFLLKSQADSIGSKIIVDHADFMSFKTIDNDQFQILSGHIAMHQDSMRLFCDSATIKNEKYVTAQSQVVIQHGISLTIFADQLYYDAELKIAQLKGNVIFMNEGRTLFTQNLEYDVETKIAKIETTTQLKADSLSLRANKGVYEVIPKVATFLDSVFVENPDFQMLTDTLKYNMEYEISEFSGPTVIQLDTGFIYAEGGYFNQVTNESGFWSNAKFERNNDIAEADTIFYDQENKISKLFGNASISQKNGSEIKGNYIERNEIDQILNIEGCGYLYDSTGILEANSIIFNQSEG